MAYKKKDPTDTSATPFTTEQKSYIDDTVGKTVAKRLKNKAVAAIEAPMDPLKPTKDAAILSQLRSQNLTYHHIPNYGIRAPQLVEQINGYINSLNGGVFYSVGLLVDAIMEDETVWGTLAVRLQSLISSRIDIIPASEDPKAIEVRDLCQKHFPLMITSAQIAELMRWGLLIGLGIANVFMDESEDGYQIPKINLWHPRFARFDWGFRQYKLVTENGGEIFLLKDDPCWMCFEPHGDFYPWLLGMIKPLSKIYLKRYWALEWWATHQEAAGSPIYGAVTPPQVEPEDEEVFVEAIANRKFAPVVRLPQGPDGNRYKLEIIQASADLYRGFEALLNYCDAKIEVLVLGQTYSTSGAQGLSSLENPGRAIRQEIRRKDARSIEQIICEKLLKPWCIANFGDVALTPTLRFDIEDKEDQVQKTKAYQTLMDAFNKAGFGQVPLDVKAILNDFDMPIADIVAPKTSEQADTSGPIPYATAPQPEVVTDNELDPDDDEDEEDEEEEDDDDEIEKLSSYQEVANYIRKKKGK